MKVDTILLDMESHCKNFNDVKEIVLARLLKDKVITDEQFNNYCEKWNIITIKPSWFKCWKNRFEKNLDDNYIFKYVKFED